MTFSEDVLALHQGILEVLILEEKTGELVVTDSASRAISLLSDRIHETINNNPLALSVILGAATKFGDESEPPKLVGLLYSQGGVMFTSLDDNRILALSASPAESYNVMRAVNEGLPGLKRQYSHGGKKDDVVKTAVEAETIARSFLANHLGESGRMRLEDISHEGTRWSISGVIRGVKWIRSRRFRVEVDVVNGAIMKYSSKEPTWSVHDMIGLVLLACALGLIGLIMFLIFK